VRDPYEVLGVDRDSTTAEVRAAFRRLAAQHHPDRNPGDPEAQARFAEVNGAHQILSDPQKRAAYDRFGPAAFRAGGVDGGVDFSGLEGLEGLFGDLLGAIGIRTGNRGDLRKPMQLTFEEAALGCTKDLTYTRADTCQRCRGDGGEPGASIEACKNCGGRGRVRLRRGSFALPIERACGRCRGTGQTPTVRCSDCRGRGLSDQERTVSVDFPAGVVSGSTRIVPRGGSRPRPDRVAGDLEIPVQVAPHPFFRRQGDNVLCTVPISFTQAALGGEVEVPSLLGKVKLRIPPATQPGHVLRLRGKGIQHRRRSGSGDQLVEVQIEIPNSLTQRARKLIEELGEELGETVHPQQRSFLEKLRRLFD
jgi:molecular chaperone DnaJ